MTTIAFKKVQYGYHGKNGVFSDHTERTYSETNSRKPAILKYFDLPKNESLFLQIMIFELKIKNHKHSLSKISNTIFQNG